MYFEDEGCQCSAMRHPPCAWCTRPPDDEEEEPEILVDPFLDDLL